MSLQLLQSTESLSLYISEHAGGTGQPWMAFLLPESHPQGPSWGMIAPFAWLENQGYFLFCPTPPANVSRFVVTAWAWFKEKGYVPSSGFRPYLVWVKDPDATPGSFDADVVVCLDAPVGPQQARVGGDSGAHLFLGANYVLTFSPQVGIDLDGSGTAFTFGPTQNIDFSANDLRASKIADQAALPLIGERAGVLEVASMTLTGPDGLGEDGLDVAMRYYAPASPAPGAAEPLSALRYPVLDLASRAESVTFEARLDPTRPTDPARTVLTLTGAEPSPLRSWFRTPRGQTLLLTPRGAGFVLAEFPGELPLPAGRRRLTATLAGTFAAGVAAAEPGARLMAGASGTEYFTLRTAGDRLDFVGGKPALAAFDPRQAAGEPSPRELLKDSGGATTTSWVSVSSTAGPTPYFLQPQRAPLFAPRPVAASGAPAEPYMLDVNPVRLWPPPGAAAATPSNPAPLVPYAGLGKTADEELYRLYGLMEQHVLSRARRAEVLGAATERQLRAAAGRVQRGMALEGSTWTTEPNGLMVAVDDATGQLEQVRLAVSPERAVEARRRADAGLPRRETNGEPQAAVPTTLLLERVQGNPLLTLQNDSVFLVATRTGPPGTSADLPRLQIGGGIDLTGWSFQPTLPEPKSGAEAKLPANSTVLLVKFGRGSIRELAGNLAAWQDAADYNASPEETRQLIAAKVAHALDDVKEKGDASLYADFARVVTDPSWNGVVVLNSEIGPVPPAILGVLVGIPPDEFRAFYVAAEVNDVRSKSSPLEIRRSALSALVDYTNPTPDQGAILDAGNHYGFLVNYLRALFLNSALRHFGCQIGLELNSLFGLRLKRKGSSPSAAGVPQPAANLLIINGVYQTRGREKGGDDAHGRDDGQGIYSFITEQPFELDFDYAQVESPLFEILNRLTLSKIQFSPASRTETTVTSRFSFWGSLAFHDSIPGIDVFNFDELVFANLGLLMTGPRHGAESKGAGAPALSWAVSTAEVSFNQSSVPGLSLPTVNQVRPEGLVGSLPLKPAALLFDPQGEITLASLGFEVLQLKATNSPTVAADTRATTGLIYNLALGTPGALASSSPLTAQVLTAFSPAGDLVLGLKIQALGDHSELKIEGVIRFYLATYALNKITAVPPGGGKGAPLVVLLLEGVTFKLLGKSFPKDPVTMTFTVLAPPPDIDSVMWHGEYGGKGGRS